MVNTIVHTEIHVFYEPLWQYLITPIRCSAIVSKVSFHMYLLMTCVYYSFLFGLMENT
jgi:hypothetical protein